jgi:hypothetical protein
MAAHDFRLNQSMAFFSQRILRVYEALIGSDPGQGCRQVGEGEETH